MATLEEIYANVLTDKEERLALAQAASDPQALAEFLGQRGCDASPEEARAFMDRQLTKTGELSNEELAATSGGGCSGNSMARCKNCGSTDLYLPSADYNRFLCRSCGAYSSVTLPRQ